MVKKLNETWDGERARQRDSEFLKTLVPVMKDLGVLSYKAAYTKEENLASCEITLVDPSQGENIKQMRETIQETFKSLGIGAPFPGMPVGGPIPSRKVSDLDPNFGLKVPGGRVLLRKKSGKITELFPKPPSKSKH
jgi:hypothetical protein